MLWEAHRGNAIDGDSQDGDEQMDKRDPVGKKRPGEDTVCGGGVLSNLFWNW